MARRFEVELLSTDEFDAVVASDPRYVNAYDSLGFADPESGRAYVRDLYWPELTGFLVNHEFEHLLNPADGADSDEFGVYHKKAFKQIIAPIALPILGALAGPLLGGIFAAGAGGLSGLGGALAAGAGGAAGGALGQKIAGGDPGRGALFGGIGGLAAPVITSALGKASSALAGAGGKSTATSALGAAAGKATPAVTRITGPAAAQPFSRIPFGATTAPAAQNVASIGGLAGGGLAKRLPFGLDSYQAQGILSRVPTSLPIANVPGLAAAGGGGGGNPLLNAFRAIGTGAKKLFGSPAGQGATAGASGDLIAKALRGSQQPQDQFTGPTLGDLLLGGGIAAVPQAGVGPQTPEVPELRQLPGVQQFESDVRSRLGPLSERAAGLSQTPLPPEAEASITRQFDRLEREITGQFKAFRPGADLATDTAYRQAIQDLRAQQAEVLTQARFQYVEQERANIQAQLGVDERQLDFLADLAGLDVQTIMARTGLSAQEAAQFRELMATLGLAVGTRRSSPLTQFFR